MTDGAATTKHEAKPPSNLRRALDWLTLSSRIAEAREFERRNAEVLEFVARAGRAARTADRVFDSPHALDREPVHALELYAQAAYWLGRAARPDEPAQAAASLGKLIALEPETQGWLLPCDEATLRVLEEPFHARAERSREEIEQRAREAQRWLAVALARAEERVSPVSELRARRALRVYPALALAVGLMLGAIVLAVRGARGPDLAASRPWRASSSLYECRPSAHQCGGVTTDIFFHTQDEDNPWVEIDLQSVRRIGRVEVDNRTDSAAERAVPLILEVSSDGKSYRKVAEQTQVFNTWDARFAPTAARYVRLRSPRKTMLHLERISVRK
jgi:hypothetical protein